MKKLLIMLILPVAVLYGCGGKDKIKPSADSIMTTEAINKIESIRNAYEVKDSGTLQSLIDEKPADAILGGLNFNKAQLSFVPKVVRITNESIMVNINWQGNWQMSNGKNLGNRGVVTLSLQKETLKLIKIDGDNPFLIPQKD